VKKKQRYRDKCSECGHDRFQTVEKDHLWRCRKCKSLQAYYYDGVINKEGEHD